MWVGAWHGCLVFARLICLICLPTGWRVPVDACYSGGFVSGCLVVSFCISSASLGLAVMGFALYILLNYCHHADGTGGDIHVISLWLLNVAGEPDCTPLQQDGTPIRYLPRERSGQGGGAEASNSELVEDCR